MSLALFLQVRYLNRGLENADAMRVVPVFQAAIVFSNSMGGVIFYGDMINESAAKQAAFAFGALIAIAGVGVLLCRKEADGHGGTHAALGGEDAASHAPTQQPPFTGSSGGGGGAAAEAHDRSALSIARSPDRARKTDSPESPLLVPAKPAAFQPWPEAQ